MNTTQTDKEGIVGSPLTAEAQQAALAQILAADIDPTLAKAAWQLIEGAQRIVLLAHEHPDCDALGSALGLALALAPYGKECVVACADPVPANADFLPGYQTVVSELPNERFDLVIALDAGELSRYGSIYTRHKAFFDSATILNMDHHITSTGCGKVTIIDPISAATAELLTLFLLNRGVPITHDVAVCLLAGVVTDTRAFEFDATTSRTLMAGAYLVGCGAVPEDIIKPIYRMKPLAKAQLWGKVLDETLASTADGRIVWALVRRAYMDAVGASPDLDEGLPNYLMDIDGIAISVIFKEHTDGTTKVSLRAAAPYDAAAIAQHFGGGGHLRAAGCSLPLPIDDAVKLLIPYVEATLANA